MVSINRGTGGIGLSIVAAQVRFILRFQNSFSYDQQFNKIINIFSFSCILRLLPFFVRDERSHKILLPNTNLTEIPLPVPFLLYSLVKRTVLQYHLMILLWK